MKLISSVKSVLVCLQQGTNDLAVIEIIEPFVDNCDVTFRKSVDKISNARLYAEHLQNIGVVHKIGAKTNMITGSVLSSEYYNKLKEKTNREYIFLVKGMGESFSEEGDSGSLVFSRPQNLQQITFMLLVWSTLATQTCMRRILKTKRPITLLMT